jgi:hypothetical protein
VEQKSGKDRVNLIAWRKIMWIDTPEGRKLAEEISRNIVVAQVAPEELDLFDELAEEYYKNPEGNTEGDGELGFGDASWLTTITPIAIPIVMSVLGILGNEIVKNIGGQVAGSLVTTVKGYFVKSGDSLPALTPEQLDHVKLTALKTAKEKGVNGKQAEKIIAILMTSLQSA